VPRYPQGQPIRLSTTVRDVTGTLVNPGSLVLTLAKPDASTQAYSTPTSDGTGLFHQDVPTGDLSLLGHYAYKWVATGTGAGVSFSNFEVFDPLEVSVLSLQDAKDHLNIAQATTTYDQEIASKVATIQASLEKMTGGPIITRTVTERVQVGSGYRTLCVRQRPLVSVTSITDVSSGVALDTSDVELDTNAGIVRRKLGLPFLGRGWVFTVVYTAGWGTAVPAAFGEAARIILEHLWQTQHGPAVRPVLGGEEEVTLPGWGFAIPNRAAELLAPYAIEAYV
jgi:hypothetical protein